MASVSTDSSPTHAGGPTLTTLPLINAQNGVVSHQTMMAIDRTSSIMSPDSEDDMFPQGLSGHHSQPFKQEVAEGIDSAYT